MRCQTQETIARMNADSVIDARGAEQGACAAFDLLFQSHFVPMGIVDPESLSFLNVNAAAQAQYGYSYGEFLRLSLRDIASDPSRLGWMAAPWDAWEASHAPVEMQHRRRDGTVIAVAARFLPTRYDNRSAVLVMMQEVSWRKQHDTPTQRDSLILRQMPVGVILTDMHQNITDWAGAAEYLLGYTARAVVGRRLEMLWDTESDNALFASFWHRLSESGTAADELPAVTADGRVTILRVAACCWRDDAGDPQGIIWVIDEPDEHRLRAQVEEHRLASALLESELLEMVAMTDVRDKLTAMMAHEFKTPLSAIKLYRDIIARHSASENEPKVRDALKRIDIQVTTLVEMINDMLLLNQHNTGKLTLDALRFDLVGLSTEVADHWRSIMGDHYRFDYQGPVHPVEILGDLKLLRRVLDNLMSNAVKYSAKGGHIALTVEQVGRDAVIRVGDEGIGIPLAAQARIFDMFERADNALHLGGTGVGLAFCRMAVEMHGGRISLESEPGKGTIFTVTLPLGAAR